MYGLNVYKSFAVLKKNYLNSSGYYAYIKMKKILKKKSVVDKYEDKLKARHKSSSGLIDASSIKNIVAGRLKNRLKEGDSFADSPHAPISGERVSTGIPGFDEIIEGGFRKNAANLISGGAGCGKSVFCMQFLVNGIRNCNENGIYITFEQTPEEIIEDMKIFGWDIQQYIKEKKLTIINYTPEQVGKILEAGGGTVRDAVESLGAKRLVLDSLTAFTLLYKSDLDKRRAILALFEAIKRWGCTSLLISEREQEPTKHESDFMEFEVDGVIFLYYIKKGHSRERSIEVIKMRSTRHAAKQFPLRISDTGITVYPDETVF